MVRTAKEGGENYTGREHQVGGGNYIGQYQVGGSDNNGVYRVGAWNCNWEH